MKEQDLLANQLLKSCDCKILDLCHMIVEAQLHYPSLKNLEPKYKLKNLLRDIETP